MSGSLTREELEGRHLADLHELAFAQGVPRFRRLRRSELVDAILSSDQGLPEEETAPEPVVAKPERAAEFDDELERPVEPEQPVEVRGGVLDLAPDGYGFLRVEGLGRSDDDVYVSRSLVKVLGLRTGDELSGPVDRSRRSGRGGRPGRYPSLVEVDRVDGAPAAEFHGADRPEFGALTPISPAERLALASGSASFAARMVDLLAVLGKGQRALVVSPPGAGATGLLREIASAVDAPAGPRPMVVLVDVRPEEITDWRRTVDVPVHGAPSDSSPETHVRLAELALERAQRLVERGEDVIVLIDSLTRLARARSLVHGRARRRDRLDDDESEESPALRFAKRWFSAARNTEEQGSLTIIGVVRIGAESEFEQHLYELLSDIANMELRLDLELARAGLFPPLDVNRSWSHASGEVLDADEAAWIQALRRSLLSLAPADAWDAVAEKIRSAPTNSELIGAGR